MLVDVVELRRRGERIAREELAFITPVRGELQLDTRHYRDRRGPLLAGLLKPGQTEWALPPLDEAKVQKIKGSNILIVGVQEFERPIRVRERCRQAWWVRVVTMERQSK